MLQGQKKDKIDEEISYVTAKDWISHRYGSKEYPIEREISLRYKKKKDEYQYNTWSMSF